ncbi:beta-N-acetylhexosaminidase [uncultured Xylophilus sp.]|uniref:beta-N-acetylhexosaminidase n=1 Tax=uncultured Xylophilus sp. TaxID=296832 RepID=UPI0025E59373|nr:beta-N-acetylhexosaminidase [uncultured Xylophilus sp.]
MLAAPAALSAASAPVHSPLIIDVAGTELTAADRRRLADPLVGGVIYFTRNWRDRAQITALSAAIKAVRPDMLICVDHEGGRVQRFRTDGFTVLPPARRFGDCWMDDAEGFGTGAQRAMDVATAAAFVMGAELRACGIDFTFAPVLDLDHGSSGVIGNRAFHRDPRVVATLARCTAHGLRQAGMQHCGKHFPGHGHVQADSHTDFPVDERSLAALLADDAAPYRWLRGMLAAVMPAHVVYPAVDSRPAGFSQRWLQEVLRAQLGFDGAIVSDDLSMEAARRIDGRTVDHAEAAIAALAAGCDLALLCNQSIGDGVPLDAALEGVAAAWRDGRLVGSAESDARRRALLPRDVALPWDALQADRRYRLARSVLSAIG